MKPKKKINCLYQNDNPEQKGITLVALVITIIILLILAGVTLRNSNWR